VYAPEDCQELAKCISDIQNTTPAVRSTSKKNLDGATSTGLRNVLSLAKLMFSSVSRLRVVKCYTIWFPTWLGLLCLCLFLATPLLWWCIYGESFLSVTQRLPAQVLVVEGWIGPDGVRAAAEEFKEGGYQYVVATGGFTTNKGWQEASRSYAEQAENELIRSGVPKDRIIVAGRSRPQDFSEKCNGRHNSLKIGAYARLRDWN
jgi:hypothetical protein